MPNTNNRAFIFDMDGTLVDNMQFHADAWQEFFREIGREIDPEDFRVKTAGMTSRHIFRQIFGESITDERIAEYSTRKEDIYRQMYGPHLQPIFGVEAFLSEAQALGIRLGVATSASERNIEFTLDGLLLRQYFQTIVSAKDITHGKPHPEIFLKSAAALGVESQNCLVFEDALNGFEAAHLALMKAVAVTTVNSRETLVGLPGVVEVVDDFTTIKPMQLIEKYFPFVGSNDAQ